MSAMKPKTTVRRILSAVWLHTVETAGREKAAAMSPKYELPRQPAKTLKKAVQMVSQIYPHEIIIA